MRNRSVRSAAYLSITGCILVSFVGACGGATGEAIRPKDFTGTGAIGGTAPACGGAPKYAKPLVVDLDGDTRLGLETAMKKGVVVVSYDCTTLRVMPNCRVVDGVYEYASGSKRELVIQLKSQDDLSVNLPLSAGKLGTELSSGRSIDLALVSVGMHSTTVEDLKKSELTGKCDAATHYIQIATIGAFSMATGSAGKAKAVAELFAVGASGSSESSRGVDTKDGSLEACRKADSESATPPTDCKAPISVQLQPFVVETAKAVAAAPPPASASNAKPPEETKKAAGQENPCRPGYVFANDICTREQTGPHLCDPKNAADCKAQCDAGSFESCFSYGLLQARYPDGQPFFKKACDNGVLDACGSYGRAIFSVEAGAKGSPEAIAFAQRGCKGGGPSSCMHLGDITIGHLNFDDPKSKATIAMGVNAYERGCKLGSDDSCGSLGEMYLQGKYVTKDLNRGLALLDRACVGAQAGPCLTLAKYLSAGIDGATKNPERAFRAARGVCGQLKGISCNDAIQIAIDVGKPAEAFQWSQQACAGWTYNCGKTAELYRDGIGTAKNPAKARELFTKACEGGKGSKGACEELSK